jgi:LysM repeat protein
LIAAGGLWLAQRMSTPPPIPTATATVTPTATDAVTLTPSATPTPTFTPTEPPTPVPSPTIPPPIRYTVQPGDTLLDLALRFNVSVEAIKAANGMTDDILIAGQELLIPVATPTPVPGATETPAPGATQAPTTVIHVVQQGETLSAIAQHYGVSMQAILDANDITDPDSIRPGDQLVIPLGTPTPHVPPTIGATATATPLPVYAAPALLVPADNAYYALEPRSGQLSTNDPIVLQWTSVGLLQTNPPDRFNEWYRVTIHNATTGTDLPPFYTRATALRLPSEFRPAGGAIYVFQWAVQVVREVGEEPDGAKRVEVNGRPSHTRTFTVEGSNPTPTQPRTRLV